MELQSYNTDNQLDNLRFLVLGDWGREGASGQRAVAQAMASYADQFKPHFLITTGDNFYEYGVRSTADPLWQKSFESVYTQDSLQIPWYPILGNHDYVLNPEAQIAYSKVSMRWNMPARYHAHELSLADGTRVLFVFLDTCPFISDYDGDPLFGDARQEDSVAQFRWLEETLATSKADWKIITGHHPLYSAGSIHGDQLDMIRLFEPLFKRYHVDVFFCGHEHDLQHLQSDGPTHYLLSGAGSQRRIVYDSPESIFAAGEFGYVAVNLNRDYFEASFLDEENTLIYQMKTSSAILST